MATKQSRVSNSGGSGWGKLLAILGGAAVAYVIAKAVSGSPEHYECPNCHTIFAGKPSSCPNCKVQYVW
ncbi:Uncharacterised protein [uncultured archaeon]|nr:Uncharacterised protein [uncultured archaeon]